MYARPCVLAGIALAAAACLDVPEFMPRTDAGSAHDAGRDGSDAPAHEGQGEGGEPSPCPADMVHVPAMRVCVDAFEGVVGEDGAARPGRGVEPTTALTIDEARDACEAAGKALCDQGVWQVACAGPAANPYPYGREYARAACNDVELWRDRQTAGRLLPGGGLETCEGGYPGLFDMSGNAAEWVHSLSAAVSGLAAVAGGSFTNSDGPADLTCISLATVEPATQNQHTGFRCCAPAP